MLRTLDDINDSRAKKMTEDGMAGIDRTEPCHHVVRFVGRTLIIEPVELKVGVLIVRDALVANFRSFDVLAVQ